MVELENKINLFRGIVWGEAKAKSEKELYDSTEKYAENLKNQKEELEKKKADYIARRKKAAEFRANSAISGQKEENKKALLAAKAECLEELMHDLENRLEDYTETSAYREVLRKEIEEIIESGGGETIAVRERDKGLWDTFTAKRISWAVLPDSEIGGYALTSADGKRRIRHTLRARLEEHSYDIGRVLYGVLEEEERL